MKRPWYTFPYKIIGFHGVLWVLIICGIGMYWSFKEATMWAFNQAPTSMTLSEIEKGPVFKRWVRVEGLGLRIDPWLFPPLKGSNENAVPGDIDRYRTIIINQDNVKARNWSPLISEIREAHADGILSGSEYTKLKVRLSPKRDFSNEKYLPQSGLILLGAGATGLQLPTVKKTDEDLLGVQVEVDERLDVLNRIVTPNLVLEGMLRPAPEDIRLAHKDRHGINSTKLGLRVGDVPSKPRFIAFLVFFVIFAFLSLGYLGIYRAAPEDGEEGENV